jgi:hypothetical protein
MDRGRAILTAGIGWCVLRLQPLARGRILGARVCSGWEFSGIFHQSGAP